MKDNYDYILVSVIAPFQDARDSARKKIGADFIELFVNFYILPNNEFLVRFWFLKT